MEPTPKPSELIGTSDAAGDLGIDPSTLTRWVERGWIEPVGKLAGPNGAYIFKRAEVARVKAGGVCRAPRVETRTAVAR